MTWIVKIWFEIKKESDFSPYVVHRILTSPDYDSAIY